MPDPLSLFVKTGRLIAGAPLRSRSWTKRQWAWRFAVGGAVVLAWAGKRDMQAFIQGHGGASATSLAKFINTYANGAGMAAVALAAFASGHFLRKQRLKDTALVFGVAGVWCAALWSAGRFVFAERRPLAGGAMEFFALDGHGFSGHAAVAALLVLPIRNVLLRRRSRRMRNALTVLVLAWVGVVGWSRVFLGMHFAWNILAGLAVGFWASAAAVETWQETHSDTPSPAAVEN